MRIQLLAVLLGTLAAGTAEGRDGCHRDCGGSARCEADVADCLYDSARVREAITTLKAVFEKNPSDPDIARRLARAYLADDNPFWAQRVLTQALARNPGHCELRSWLAWVHLKQGLMDEAEEVLARPGCPRTAAERGRWALLRAFSADARKTGKAAPYLAEARQLPELYPEDRGLLDHLRAKSDPGWIAPLDLRVEPAVGYTSNARAGLPLDRPADPNQPGPSSVLGRLDLVGRFVWPARGRVRPALDMALLGYALAGEDARKYSFAEVWARPGVILGRAPMRLLFAYKADVFLLPDRPAPSGQEANMLYYQAHRGEVELEAESYVLYAGAGYRAIDEPGRDRTEFDGGGGWSLSLSRRSHVILGAMARYQLASNVAYDLVGGTGLLVLRQELPRGLSGQLTLSGGLDHYPSSAGYFATPDKRRDVLWGASAALWGPRWGRARLGLLYDYARRDSTANPGVQYDLEEHRAMLKIRWSLSADPFTPRARRTSGHVPLDYGLGGAEREERLRELLQQDDADRRSSCGCGG